MSEWQQKLEAAGWSVKIGNGAAFIKEPGAPEGYAGDAVVLNADGTLHLVRERSALHRRIGAALNMVDVTLPPGMT